MGRSPCCSKEGLNRGAWTALEDKILTAYIKAHGEGKWRNLPKRAGTSSSSKHLDLGVELIGAPFDGSKIFMVNGIDL
ncbi:hypothetical protein OIU76_009052 [Salix suchowensis]|nr:hypothetical protein OIU76_009052 [Salix suchowensis]